MLRSRCWLCPTWRTPRSTFVPPIPILFHTIRRSSASSVCHCLTLPPSGPSEGTTQRRLTASRACICGHAGGQVPRSWTYNAPRRFNALQHRSHDASVTGSAGGCSQRLLQAWSPMGVGLRGSPDALSAVEQAPTHGTLRHPCSRRRAQRVKSLWH